MDALLTLLAEEFWSIVLVAILISIKSYRVGGIMLIALRSVNGSFNWWATVIITIFIIFKAWWWDNAKEPPTTVSPPPPPPAIRKDPDQPIKQR